MTIDGHFRYANEDERMKALREEEECLGIQPLEIPNNALISARLVRIDTKQVQHLQGEEAHEAVAKKDAHYLSGQVEEMDGTLLGAMA